jgi:LacI family repressor for deo operon, udp, cdd, tsx, nupC, and nupG
MDAERHRPGGRRRSGAGRRNGRQPRVDRPTISDVAQRAGVSRSAVSFAVNGRPGVAPETRARILRVAEELGWRPSGSARALTRSQAGAIGLAVVRRSYDVQSDYGFVRFLAGVERALAASDYGLLLHRLPEEGSGGLDAYRRLLGSGRIDGVLLTDVVLDDARPDMVAESGLPAVVAGSPWRNCAFPVVEAEHASGMAALVQHLIRTGHRAIAFIGGDPVYEQVAACRWAWIETMRNAGLEPGLSASVVPEDAAGRAATARLLRSSRRPTAIVYTSDLLALAGLGVARQEGLSVPDDISITGFDGSPVAMLSCPPLTTVRVDYGGFGEAAGARLLAEIDGVAPPRSALAPPELIVRGSTGPPPARD